MELGFLCAVWGWMNYDMWILLYGFLIFQFLFIRGGIFRKSILQCCFVSVVYYVFSRLVFCGIFRSRVFGGCPFLVGSLCFAEQKGFDSCVPLCCPLLDPVGLSSILLFYYCWSISGSIVSVFSSSSYWIDSLSGIDCIFLCLFVVVYCFVAGFCCCMFGCFFVYFVFPIFLVAFQICRLWRSVLLFYICCILCFLLIYYRGVLCWICIHISSSLGSCCYLMVWVVCFFFVFVVFVFVLGWSRIHLDYVRIAYSMLNFLSSLSCDCVM